MPKRNQPVNGLKKKGVLTAALVPSFYGLEWLLFTASATAFSFLRYQGLSDLQIWLLFWISNMALSILIILFADRLGADITLMQTLRRLLNGITRKSRWFGYTLETAIFLRLLIWDGPCQLLIFFRERLPSGRLQAGFIVLTSGLQMFLWARLYALGYESVSELFRG